LLIHKQLEECHKNAHEDVVPFGYMHDAGLNFLSVYKIDAKKILFLDRNMDKMKSNKTAAALENLLPVVISVT